MRLDTAVADTSALLSLEPVDVEAIYAPDVALRGGDRGAALVIPDD